uniref:N-acetyldiaminopimelate deacetylase n=1 Tax=Lygus hesperus TaxID=30085 RepID=A0A0A9YIV6_LYGHE
MAATTTTTANTLGGHRVDRKRVRVDDDDKGALGHDGLPSSHHGTRQTIEGTKASVTQLKHYTKNGTSTGLPHRHLEIDVLTEMASEINAAIQDNDVNLLRLILCKLEHVDVYPSELERSKIGVAVGNIVGSEFCKSLWPLARALISFWARHLPKETLYAIKQLQEKTRSSATLLQDSSGAAQPSSPQSPLQLSSPYGVQEAPSSPTSLAASRRSTFFAELCRFLDNPSSLTRVDADTIDRVARNFAQIITSKDDRRILLLRLKNP